MPNLFDPATIIAKVDGHPILAGDVEGLINQMLAPHVDEAPQEVLLEQKEKLVRRYLENLIEIKMMYLEFERSIPPERKATGLGEIWGRVYQAFDDEQLPAALKSRSFTHPADLDAYLRQFGWSLAKQKRLFGEKQLGQAAIIRQINRNPEVTVDEMSAYYRDHLAEYTSTARARWEQLSAYFDKSPTREAAHREIAEMGNEVFFGAPFAAVAKRRSHDYLADQGGLHEWTSQGSLVSKPLDEALFLLPLNRLSTIIEDEKGFHIIRVLERDPSAVTPFTEAQPEIRDQLREEKREQQFQELVQDLKKRTTTWTIFDDQPAQQ